MTEKDLFKRMQNERSMLPSGFDMRSDRLLLQLSTRKRKVSMKKTIVFALASVLLLGSIAYAATRLNLSSIIFGHQTPTVQQRAYVDESTRYATISQVKTGGKSRGDYSREDLAVLPIDQAIIQDIAGFTDGTRIVIGFASSETAPADTSFSCDGFFANDQPIAGGLMEEKQGERTVYLLDSELPDSLVDQPLTVTLALHLYGLDGAMGYQYVTFNMDGARAEKTQAATAAISDQMTAGLLAGTASPLGLRLPLSLTLGDQVSFISNVEFELDGVAYPNAELYSARNAGEYTAMLAFDVPQVANTLSVKLAWEERVEREVYTCAGTVVFSIADGRTEVTAYTRDHAYTLPEATPEQTTSTEIPIYDADAMPRDYTLTPTVLTAPKLLELSSGVLTPEVLALQTVERTDDGTNIYFIYYTDEQRNTLAGYCSYDKQNGRIEIVGPGEESENFLGDIDAPNAALTRDGAWQVATDYLARFGYTPAELRLESLRAFVAGGQGGYVLHINILDGGMPRYAKRYDSFVMTDWRLMINERGVCQVYGRVCEMTDDYIIDSALELEQAQVLLDQAIMAGEVHGITAPYTISAIRAVSIDPMTGTQNAASTYVPAWEFDIDGITRQICVNRDIGKIIDMNMD